MPPRKVDVVLDKKKSCNIDVIKARAQLVTVGDIIQGK